MNGIPTGEPPCVPPNISCSSSWSAGTTFRSCSCCAAAAASSSACSSLMKFALVGAKNGSSIASAAQILPVCPHHVSCSIQNCKYGVSCREIYSVVYLTEEGCMNWHLSVGSKASSRQHSSLASSDIPPIVCSPQPAQRVRYTLGVSADVAI